MAGEARDQAVSLGCGTLILIALIVLFFSGRGHDEMTRELHDLRTEVSELRVAVEAQTALLNALRGAPGEPRGEAEGAREADAADR
jgi:hypothetical protein